MQFSFIYRLFIFISTFLFYFSHAKAQTLPLYLDASASIEDRVTDIMSKMTWKEKVGQMAQYSGDLTNNNNSNFDEQLGYSLETKTLINSIKSGEVSSFLKMPSTRAMNNFQKAAMSSRLKIPLLFTNDAVHGIAWENEPGTVFPMEIGIAASFDTSLAKMVANAVKDEMIAVGLRLTYSPNIEIGQDPRWGRIGDTFGEDPYLVTLMGEAFLNGYQGYEIDSNSVIGCLKHFVGGSIAINGLNGAPADISERTLEEIFFPPFQQLIKLGAKVIMPAHNEVNGIPCHSNQYFMQNLIRKKWGFKGFFLSDWNDVRNLYSVHHIVPKENDAYILAVNSGVDMNMQGPKFLPAILEGIQKGVVDTIRINQAVANILSLKFKLGLFEHPFTDEKLREKHVLTAEHKEIALKAAEESMVLLKNDKNILPLQNKTYKIFVTGPNANNQSMLGDWARLQPTNQVVTMLQGLNNVSDNEKIVYYDCGNLISISDKNIKEAVQKSEDANINIVFVGENSLRSDPDSLKTSGENIDRQDLDLQGRQLDLLKALKSNGKPLIVVFTNGVPISSPWVSENADAILESWEGGSMAGQAVANAIFGKINPGGKLPVTIVRSAGQIRTNYYYKPSAYHRGTNRFASVNPLYPFGFGLSYTTFRFDKPVLENHLKEKTPYLTVRIKLSNIGNKAGSEVVQVYERKETSPIPRANKLLKAFQKIYLKIGESKEVIFKIPAEELKYFNSELKPALESGIYTIMIGNSSADNSLQKVYFEIK